MLAFPDNGFVRNALSLSRRSLLQGLTKLLHDTASTEASVRTSPQSKKLRVTKTVRNTPVGRVLKNFGTSDVEYKLLALLK